MIPVSSPDNTSATHMPSVGLGLWKVDPASVGELIHEAISVGYRHLDSACDYGNEAEVGKGIERVLTSNLCHREDLWVTSKLWNTFHEYPQGYPLCYTPCYCLALCVTACAAANATA